MQWIVLVASFISLQAAQADEGLAGFMMPSCFVENLSDDVTAGPNINNVETCLNCFRQIEADWISAEWLTEVRSCINSVLPGQDKGCASDIASIEAMNYESLAPAKSCFEAWVKDTLIGRCLESSNSTSRMDKLTESSLCMVKYFDKISNFPASASHSGENEDHNGQDSESQESREQDGLDEYVQRVLLPAVLCHVANSEDMIRSAQCTQCFESHANGSSGEGLKECWTFLLPNFQFCTPDAAGGDILGIQECFVNEVVRYLVATCSPGEEGEVDKETALSTLECAEEYVKNWLYKHTRPQYLEDVLQAVDNNLVVDLEENQEEDQGDNLY